MALGWKDKNDNIFWKSARTSDIHSLLLPILQHQGRHSDIQPPEMVLCWAQFNLGLVKIIRILEREHTLHNLDWANNKSGCRLFCDVLAYSLHQIFIISTSTDRFGFILLHNVYSTIPVSNGGGGEILTNTKFITFSLIWSPSLIACKYRYRLERFWIYTKASKQHYLFSFSFSVLDIKFWVKG